MSQMHRHIGNTLPKKNLTQWPKIGIFRPVMALPVPEDALQSSRSGVSKKARYRFALSSRKAFAVPVVLYLSAR